MANPELEAALRIARVMMDTGISLDAIMALPGNVIPAHLKNEVRTILEQEQSEKGQVIYYTNLSSLVKRKREINTWLQEQDRSKWYYWPALRNYLIDVKGWSKPIVTSIDATTDSILTQFDPPSNEEFDIRGLVIGYVQSGKTANFSALIAKSVDVGFRLVIVLSGIHNSLRRQTQIRLNRELVGYTENHPGSIKLPPQGQRWFSFTDETLQGDFEPGKANFASLQGSQPVLIVAKKNGPVLQKLLDWLNSAPKDILNTLPLLVIDDEADQASVNTGGNHPADDDEEDEVNDDTSPSVINGRVRSLLHKFKRSAYVGYTATPFANVLIPHSAFDKSVGKDLYPKDFILSLPKPADYFGPEEIFGRSDGETEIERDGLNVIRTIPVKELDELIPPKGAAAQYFQPTLPQSLQIAMLDFILAGAARRQRGDMHAPAAMLIHVHMRTAIQQKITELVQQKLNEIRDEWRYQRDYGIRTILEDRWIKEFRPLIRSLHADLDISFDILQEHIGPFFEALKVKQINFSTEDELDYEKEPELKAIIVGGNRLSRGLTLEGLLVSFYVRKSTMYDTLMQMGRWFGYRQGYEDLTRIYTTKELETTFSDLATVEYQLRSDLKIYENEGITPEDLGPRILKHPALLVTSRLKSRFANEIPDLEPTFSHQLLQTFKFPFQDLQFLKRNLDSTRTFIGSLGLPVTNEKSKQTLPVWTNVPWRKVVDFLKSYSVHENQLEGSFPIDLLSGYIIRSASKGELTGWTVAIKGLKERRDYLKSIDLGIADQRLVNSIERTRFISEDISIGILRSTGDEETDLTDEQIEKAEELSRTEGIKRDQAVRRIRPAQQGLLLIYPISPYSGYGTQPPKDKRQPLFPDPDKGIEVIGIALSFPYSEKDITVKARFANNIIGNYVTGTVRGWKAEN